MSEFERSLAGLPPEFADRTRRYRDFTLEFKGESDRGCAVLVLCVLEEHLQEMFRALIVLGTEKHVANLSPPGALQRALQNAQLLGLLSQRQSRSFGALANVRNAFAHRPMQKLTFESPDILSLLDSVPPAIDLPPNIALVDNSPRTRFLLYASILWMIMLFKLPNVVRLAAAGDIPTSGMPGYGAPDP